MLYIFKDKQGMKRLIEIYAVHRKHALNWHEHPIKNSKEAF
jgi:hypothetical protein